MNFQGWKQGYFETIGNQAVTLKEASVDYGFFDDYETQYCFYSLEGELLEHKPKYTRLGCLASYGYVGRQTQRVLYGEK
ncbi:hypothetical protein ACP8HI_02575 [Paenibacillus sp. FA6]|uniref:hypothetical protein n=1 Tax=Paenibacillus sp. FA6 TaxID=3413029 RepID=UPI003F6572E1